MSPLELDRITRRFLDSGAFSGAIVRVEGMDGPLLESFQGLARAGGEGELPLEPGHRFDLASVTKLFTTTAILRLVSLGRLGLGDRVAGDSGLLGWTGPRLAAPLAGVTVASLLAHASGLHYWYPFYTRRGEAFEAILADVLRANPRKPEVIYSDLNFMILGKVVEAVTGLGLRDAMADLVLRPLGLGRAGYGPVAPEGVVAGEYGNRIEEGMVAALGLSFDAWRPRDRAVRGEADDGNCHYYFGGAAGHAGLFSDARDLASLGRLYLGGGIPARGDFAGRAFLDPGLVAESCQDHGGGRGLGFQLGDNYPEGGFGHTGFTGTYLHVNRRAGLVIAILTNRLHVPEPRRINDYWTEMSEAILKGM